MLQAYFLICREGLSHKIPPVILVSAEELLPYFGDTTGHKFNEYRKENPLVRYFLADGSHRSCAAAMTLTQCPALILENQTDIEKMQELSAQGRVFRSTPNASNINLTGNFDKLKNDLCRHFEESGHFWTVSQKTIAMMGSGCLPGYMVDYYSANKVPGIFRQVSMILA